jgi:hypothetical protein
MKTFLQRFGAFVLGVLHGFDRLRFRGSKRLLCYPNGVSCFLWQVQVLFKDYKSYAKATTVSLCKAVETEAKQARLYRYLNNCQESKEAAALELAAKHRRKEGLIAVLGCVEPCQIVQVRKNPKTKLLEPRIERGKCLHYYHYYQDPIYGLRYTRLQSWFPFTMHVGLNGRDWLAQQMTKAGLTYVKKDNCFAWVEDWQAAQQLLDKQLRTDWPKLLDRWARESHPWLSMLLTRPVPYYWSVEEGEFASDIAFRSAANLAQIYPAMVQHGYATLQSSDVLRFLGYRVKANGQPYKNFDGEVLTSIVDRPEGTRVKHQAKRNTLKMYDKQESVLRVESQLMDVRDFKVYRSKEGDDGGNKEWLRMRKGVADMHGRAEVSQKINERYAASLATVVDKTPLAELTNDLGKPTAWKGRRVRALNPLAPEDVALLEAVGRGEFLIQGFRNRDLRAIMFPESSAASAAEQKRKAAKVTRLLRLLRAHGLITKIPKTMRYQTTEKGRHCLSALLAARQANTQKLLQAA